MNNNGIAPIIAILIIAIIIGGTTTTYVVMENEKSADIQPTTVLMDNRGYSSTDSDLADPIITEESLSIAETFDKVCTYLGINDTEKYKEHIDDLNVEVFAITGRTMPEVVGDYKQKIDDDGYEIIVDKLQSDTGWSGELIFAKGLLHGRIIAVASGPAVDSHFDCDVLLVISHAMLTTYNELKEEFDIEV